MIRAVLGALVLLSGTALAAESWQRPWTVRQVICPTCTQDDMKSLRSILGTVIVLGPDRFDNPLYESCPKGVDYSKMRPVSVEEAQRVIRPAQLAPRLDGPVVAGEIACLEPNGSPNTIGRFVFSGASGYYLFEGGALLELR